MITVMLTTFQEAHVCTGRSFQNRFSVMIRVEPLDHSEEEEPVIDSKTSHMLQYSAWLISTVVSLWLWLISYMCSLNPMFFDVLRALCVWPLLVTDDSWTSTCTWVAAVVSSPHWKQICEGKIALLFDLLMSCQYHAINRAINWFQTELTKRFCFVMMMMVGRLSN